MRHSLTNLNVTTNLYKYFYTQVYVKAQIRKIVPILIGPFKIQILIWADPDLNFNLGWPIQTEKAMLNKGIDLV